jgi:hypothetical protein
MLLTGSIPLTLSPQARVQITKDGNPCFVLYADLIG